MVERLTPTLLDDDLPMNEWQRLRSLQLGGAAMWTNPDSVYGVPSLRDDMPVGDWQRIRKWQLSSGASDDLGRPVERLLWSEPRPTPKVSSLTSTAPRTRAPLQPETPPMKGPLTGRPGDAAIVARALNTVVSAPNTSAPLPLREFNGTLSRGAGRDIRAQGVFKRIPLGARGVLDPPTGRAEVSASAIAGQGIGLPPRVRVYTTPTGELDVDLAGPVKLGPVTLRPRGTYVIGTPDPPRHQ